MIVHKELQLCVQDVDKTKKLYFDEEHSAHDVRDKAKDIEEKSVFFIFECLYIYYAFCECLSCSAFLFFVMELMKLILNGGICSMLRLRVDRRNIYFFHLKFRILALIYICNYYEMIFKNIIVFVKFENSSIS